MIKRVTALCLVLLTVLFYACARRGNEAAVTVQAGAALPAVTEAPAEAEPVTEQTAQPTTAREQVTDAPRETAALSRTAVTTAAPASQTEKHTEPVTKSMRVKGYGKQELIDYFITTALNSERGISPHRVIRWAKPVRVYLAGHYTDTDKALVQGLCDTLNQIDGFPGIAITDSVTDIDIYMMFEGSARLARLIENYGLLDDGYCGVVWNGSYEITNAVIGINSGMVNITKRRSVICEEFMQAMGLLNDSYDYKESVFYQASDSVTWPANLDWGLVTMLYHPAMKPGYKEREARAAANLFVKNG